VHSAILIALRLSLLAVMVQALGCNIVSGRNRACGPAESVGPASIFRLIIG
jgi:hypothetical protein